MAKAREYPGFANLDTDLKLNTPQLNVSVDRDKAADMGIQVETLGRTLETLLGGRQVTRFKPKASNMTSSSRSPTSTGATRKTCGASMCAAPDGRMVPLSNLIQIRETVAPKELNHFNQLRAATITANLAPGYTIGDGLDFLDKAAEETLQGQGADGLFRPVARVQGDEPPASTSPSCSRSPSSIWSVGAVRELPRSADHHADGAAVDGRRAARALAQRRHAQHLQPGRSRHADRPDHQARHPDRGVLQPAPRGRAADPRGGDRVRGAAPAADPDDDRRHGARRGAARHRDRRRRAKAARISAG